MEHSVRRGRARADGGQRRGAQARVADATDRRADRFGVRAGRSARGPRAGGARPGHRRGAGRVERGQGVLHELGGKDPMIVLSDAHLEHAIAGALWGGFANAGQTCSGIERVYVERAVADRFIAGGVAGAERLRGGDPMSWNTEIGPMVSGEQRELVRELVDDAVAAGATLRCGGPIDAPAGLDGAFYSPTVLTGVTHDMRIMREEIFGPVLPIVVVDSEAEAVVLANDSDFGLGASV